MCGHDSQMNEFNFELTSACHSSFCFRCFSRPTRETFAGPREEEGASQAVGRTRDHKTVTFGSAPNGESRRAIRAEHEGVSPARSLAVRAEEHSRRPAHKGDLSPPHSCSISIVCLKAAAILATSGRTLEHSSTNGQDTTRETKTSRRFCCCRHAFARSQTTRGAEQVAANKHHREHLWLTHVGAVVVVAAKRRRKSERASGGD